MSFLSRKLLQSIREDYPKGTRVQLVSMEDPYHPVPAGTRGTVTVVDDAGTIHVSWDNGSSLGLIYGEDRFVRLGGAEK